MVTPSAVIEGVEMETVVKVPAAGVVPPMTVLSTVPEFMSIFETCTEPEPFPDSTKSSLDLVTFNTLSVRLMLESIVRLETLTTPVPPGVRLRSAFELVLIMLSLKSKLSMVVVPTKDEAPDTVRVDSVVLPVTSRVELATTAPPNVDVSAVIVPSTIKFSLTFIMLESVPVIDVPENPTPSTTTLPDPLAVILMSSFDLVTLMLLSSIVRPGNTVFPVPEGLITMSASED